MLRSKNSKLVALILSVLMITASVVPVIASATDWSDSNVVYGSTTFGTDDYYNVISQKEWTLVPGAATETEMVLNNSSGTRRQVMHIIEVDPSNPDISIVPGYYNIDKDITDVNNQQAATVTSMVSYYEDELGYNVVGAMNTSLTYDNNAPFSWLVYNGNVLVDHKNGINDQHSGYAKTMLCVYKNPDETCYCELRTAAQGLRGDEWQAVSANFAMVVNNGQLVSSSVSRSSAAARSMVGIKEDGTLVLVMNDGRNANNSIGFSDYEEGEAMLSLGCQYAFNCDGGGSSSFVTKRAGETDAIMRSVPCDGAERPTLHAVMITSNVGPTGVLGNVDIDSDYDYFAPGISYTFGAEAIDTHGYSMDVPADATWSLSDASYGTINGGVFTSSGVTGDVDIQVSSGGNIVGTKTIHIANPTSLSLSSSSTTLPYSTAAKVRTTTIPVVATIGESDVYTNGAFNISLSNPNGGTLDGLTITATSDTSVSSVVATLTYIPTNAVFTYTVNYGKGSETVWDFEDGDISAWAGTDEAEQYLYDHGVTGRTYQDFTSPFGTLWSGGQISFSNKTTTALSSVANGGKAHSGDKSLAVTFDMKNVEFNTWVYSIIWNLEGNMVLRDVANGQNATAFGCWVYVPEGFYTAKNSGANAMQLTTYVGYDSSEWMGSKAAADKAGKVGFWGTQLNLQYNLNGTYKNINQLTEANIPENRWVYVRADLTGFDYVALVDPLNDIYRSPSFIRMYVKPSESQELTYYFDDWTLDYSSAVDDRNPPVISNPTYCISDSNIDLNGNTITSNVVSFNANVADYAASNAEGLDYSSAKIYVDGNAVSGVTASGSYMSVDNVTLSNGTHKITFEIADRLGNASTLSKTITVNSASARSAVSLAGHNDLNNTIEAGSVYYIDITADAIEDISSVTATIELQSAHEWELDHIIYADGFSGSYTLNSIKDNIATVTIEKTGDNNLTGGAVIASLPVRVWSFDTNTLVGGDSAAAPTKMTAAQRYASKGEPVLLVEADVLDSSIVYSNNATGSFYDTLSVATAVTGNKTQAWHEHTVTDAADVAPTCTQPGYENRTYCEVCGSVIDWGTSIPATGHTYVLVNGVLQCEDCDNPLGNYTGLFESHGSTFYAIGGNLVNGWQQIGDDYYYFDTTTNAGFDGTHKISDTGVSGSGNYVFEDGKLTAGVWVSVSGNYRYYYGPDYYRRAWVEIDGNTYYFGLDGYRLTGYQVVSPNYNARPPIYYLYEFDSNGVLLQKIDTTGIYNADGTLYYLVDGVLTHTGLAVINGETYYFNSEGKAAQSVTRYVAADTIDESATNAGFTKGYYTFDADGKVVKADETYSNSQLASMNTVQYNAEVTGIRTKFEINAGASVSTTVVEAGAIVRNDSVSTASMSVDVFGALSATSGQAKVVVFKDGAQVGSVRRGRDDGKVTFNLLLKNISNPNTEYSFRGYAVVRDSYGKLSVVYSSAYNNLSYNGLISM